MLALYDRLVEAGRRDGDFAEAARIVSSARPSQAFLDYWSGMDQRLWEFLKRCQDHDPVPDALRGWLDERADTGWISSVLTEIESFRALARHAPEAASRLPAVLDLIDLIDLIPLDRPSRSSPRPPGPPPCTAWMPSTSVLPCTPAKP
jgi:hypothetical protein